MTRTRLLIGMVLLVALAATGRWDGSWERKGQIVTNGASVGLTVPTNSYIKAECTLDTYLGNFTGNADGGPPCTATTCSLIRFTLGEKYYSQLLSTENQVQALSNGASTTCQVFRSRN